MYRPLREADSGGQRAEFQVEFGATPSNSTLVMLDRSVAQAVRFRRRAVDIPQLFLGALEVRPNLAEGSTLNFENAQFALGFILRQGADIREREQVTLTSYAHQAIQQGVLEAEKLHALQTEPEHLVLGILRLNNDLVTGLVESAGLTQKKFIAQLEGSVYAGPLSSLQALRELILDPNTTTEDRNRIDTSLRLVLDTHNSQPK